MLCAADQRGCVLEHVSDEGDDVQSGGSFGLVLVIFDEPSATNRASKGPFNDPTLRQQDKAAFGLWQFDYFEGDLRLSRSFGANWPPPKPNDVIFRENKASFVTLECSRRSDKCRPLTFQICDAGFADIATLLCTQRPHFGVDLHPPPAQPRAPQQKSTQFVTRNHFTNGNDQVAHSGPPIRQEFSG